MNPPPPRINIRRDPDRTSAPMIQPLTIAPEITPIYFKMLPKLIQAGVEHFFLPSLSPSFKVVLRLRASCCFSGLTSRPYGWEVPGLSMAPSGKATQVETRHGCLDPHQVRLNWGYCKSSWGELGDLDSVGSLIQHLVNIGQIQLRKEQVLFTISWGPQPSARTHFTEYLS